MSGLANVKGGFFGQYATTYASIQNRNPLMHRVAQLLGKKGMLATRQLMRALDGVVPGSNATKTLSRIANDTELGGKRAIETETLVNRNTTSGDVTEINDHILSLTTKTTMASPANKDGNPLGTR